MGRKSRQKQKTRSVAPDDYFAAGPFEFARFGRQVIGRSRASVTEWEETNAKMAAHLPTITAEIDDLVAQIAEQVARLPGERLLHRAWWEFAMINIRRDGPSESDSLASMRMIDYVQSVIVSVKPAKKVAPEVSEEEWRRLSKRVKTLFTRLTFEYQIALTASKAKEKKDLDMELEEFRYRAEVIWMNVRGERYQCHEKQALEDILLPHSDVLVQLFGIDAQTLIDELDKILAKLSRGLMDMMVELESFREDTLNRLEQLAKETGSTDIETLRDKVFEDPASEARRHRVSGVFFGLDLYDVAKNTNIPQALLDELSWSPGEEEDFFAPGPFCGWPVRVWPTMKRPFICLKGRTLCFDMFALFDGFYRVIQRIVFRLKPDYRTVWNERQKAVSEELPFKYLSRLLPGAQVIRPVYYRWKSGEGPAQWHEADGLVIYDDHLIVVEVKAGAFTYTSPATDLSAHIASLENLARGPALQGNRFVNYLESVSEIVIADSNHNEIGKLQRSSFRQVTICAVTLDPFSALAARAQHLKKIGIDLGKRPVWLLSVDDLRVYADLIGDPLTFLHFVEQRMIAAQSELVDLFGEMDHLGLYVKENNYAMYAAELVGPDTAKLQFDGYRTPIDEYYSAVIRGEPAVAPRQEIPARIAEIIKCMNKSQKPQRSAIASFLLDAAGDHRKTIAQLIDEQLKGNAEFGRPKPFSAYGDHAFTLLTWSPSVQRDAEFALRHTRAVLAAAHEKVRLMIELEYDAEDTVVDVHWCHVSLEGLSATERTRAEEDGNALRRQRVAAAMRDHKVGVNEPCPCGSGKKFKKCCRR
ncbi:MAG: SEC-C metal-binding domain-containing protein [Desulfobulbus sp.]|nr:SEC-C metal-binding domain-containing protein [Desulfobulbus sp.]